MGFESTLAKSKAECVTQLELEDMRTRGIIAGFSQIQLVSQVYVDTNKFIRSLVYFYNFFALTIPITGIRTKARSARFSLLYSSSATQFCLFF